MFAKNSEVRPPMQVSKRLQACLGGVAAGVGKMLREVDEGLGSTELATLARMIPVDPAWAYFQNPSHDVR